MTKIIHLPKFRPGQMAYLHQSTGGCFMVHVQSAYRHKGEWYYDLDASCYSPGLELEWVSENYLTFKSHYKPIKRLSTKLLNQEI